MADGQHTVLLLNGVNLNRLGQRQPEIYGSQTLAQIVDALSEESAELGLTLNHFQSNAEHELVERIHAAADDGTDIFIINPGAFTHTSIALRDALLSVDAPFIEVHLSNIASREPFRQHSYFSDIAIGSIVGFGVSGYSMALHGALHYLQQQ